ncbi:MAG: NTP transferase domain-containing protein [Candidatus Anammoxibacter sp.]
MKCLIIAAGKGSRLQNRGKSKPLIPVLGIPLIERVIRSVTASGINDFYIVTGYQGELVKTFIGALRKRIGINVTFIVNNEWEKDNGHSVLKAKGSLNEPFLLLMADHLFDPVNVKRLIKHPLDNGDIILGVDKDVHNPLIDLDDVTKVSTEKDEIREIGKNLTGYNGFDTGIFLCTPAIFNAIERRSSESNDTTLSGAVQLLAATGNAKVHDIEGYWIDVDDSVAIKKAESILMDDLKSKQNDGPVSRYLNRPISKQITRRIAGFRISPNQISLFSFILSIIAASLFALNDYVFLLAGGFLAQIASIVDGCDGEIARLKFQNSSYGGWLDAVLDRYADSFLLLGLIWHGYSNSGEDLFLLIGFLAIIGSFMLSYTADKYDSLMKSVISLGNRFRIGRDIRVFIMFLGAVSNHTLATLIIIAALTNIETIRRVIICRGNEPDSVTK